MSFMQVALWKYLLDDKKYNEILEEDKQIQKLTLNFSLLDTRQNTRIAFHFIHFSVYRKQQISYLTLQVKQRNSSPGEIWNPTLHNFIFTPFIHSVRVSINSIQTFNYTLSSFALCLLQYRGYFVVVARSIALSLVLFECKKERQKHTQYDG